MKKAQQVIADFLGDDVEGFALNVIVPLDFMLQQKEHKRRFEEVLEISCPGISFNDFKKVVSAKKDHYEKHQDETKHILATKIEISGKVIATLKDSPIRWLFISIYWAYNFRDHSVRDIQKKYDPRIGDISLTFIRQISRMKKMEMTKGLDPHSDKFYTNLAVQLVRVIEILVAMSDKQSTYINRVYLNNKIYNIASNFLHTLLTNRFEKNTIDVAKTKNGSHIIRYKNTVEHIEFFITSTRMIKDGSMPDVYRTYNEYKQLLHLTPVRNSRSKTKTSGKR